MDFNLSPEQLAYRESVRHWVRENLPRAPRRSGPRPEAAARGSPTRT
jgi:hypothetical protein